VALRLPALPDGSVTEVEFENFAIRALVRDTFGYLCEHTRTGRQKGGAWTTPHTVAGFPDWACYGSRGRHFLIETKGTATVTEPEQLACILDLRRRGHEVYLWRAGRIDVEEMVSIIAGPQRAPDDNADLRWEMDRVERRLKSSRRRR